MYLRSDYYFNIDVLFIINEYNYFITINDKIKTEKFHFITAILDRYSELNHMADYIVSKRKMNKIDL